MNLFYRSIISLLLSIISHGIIASGSWIDFQRWDDIAFFLFSFPPRIERYDAASSSWLDPIDLPSPGSGLPTSIRVDDSHIFVAFGRAVYRYDYPDGAASTSAHVINLGDDDKTTVRILTDGNLIFVTHGWEVTSLDRTKNVVIDNKEVHYGLQQGLSISPTKNKIIGRSSGVSPSDIYYLDYEDNGTLGSGLHDSPYHGDYSSASKTWVFPDGASVLDSSGNVYSVDSLTHLNAFASQVTDVDWYEDATPIVLDGNTLTAYDRALLPTGSYTLDTDHDNLIVKGSDAFIFNASDSASSSDNGISVTKIALALLSPPDPSQPLNPNGLVFEPEKTFLDRHGILHLFSKKHQSIFRWDPNTQSYIDSIGLVGFPLYVAYSDVTDTIYTAYESGLIRSIDSGNLSQEEPFATLPSVPLGLATASNYLFAVDASGAWQTHYTYSPNGTMISSVDWNYQSQEYVWSEANQKMYFFRDGSSPNDILWEEINVDGVTYPDLPPGGIGKKIDSPDHSSSGIKHPIRVKKDGSVVLLGSGVFRDAISLERVGLSLANEIADAVFLEKGLMTIRNIAGLSQFQEWNGPSMALGDILQVPGKALALFSIPDTTLFDKTNEKLLGITLADNGVPSYYIVDESMAVLSPQVLQTPFGLKAIPASSQIDLEWRDISGETGYIIERNDSSTGWSKIGTTAMSITSYSDGYVDPLIGKYTYRVIAVSSQKKSSPSIEVSVRFGPPRAPSNLSATVQSSTSVKLTWEPSEDAEKYVLERKLMLSGSSDFQEVATLVSSMHSQDYNYYWPPGETLHDVNLGEDDNKSSDAPTFYEDHDLSPGTSYSYRVSASNSFGTSKPSDVVTFTTPQENLVDAPYLHSILSQHNSSGLVVYLGFSYHVSSVDQYEISRSEDSVDWMNLATVDSQHFTGSFYDANVMYSTTYFYRVRARNSFSVSSWSGVREVTTVAAPPRLVASAVPRKLVVNLTWDYSYGNMLSRNVSPVSRYALYRKDLSNTTIGAEDFEWFSGYSTDGSANWISDLSPSLSNYLDTSIKEGHGYIYRLHALGSSRSEAISNTVLIQPIKMLPNSCGWECVCGDVTTTDIFGSERCMSNNALQLSNSTIGGEVNISTAATDVTPTPNMRNESEEQIFSSSSTKRRSPFLFISIMHAVVFALIFYKY